MLHAIKIAIRKHLGRSGAFEGEGVAAVTTGRDEEHDVAGRARMPRPIGENIVSHFHFVYLVLIFPSAARGIRGPHVGVRLISSIAAARAVSA